MHDQETNQIIAMLVIKIEGWGSYLARINQIFGKAQLWEGTAQV